MSMLSRVPGLRRPTATGLVASVVAVLLMVTGAAAVAGTGAVTADGPEVVIRDTSSDTGAEPSTVSPWWVSPAIRVCEWTPVDPPVKCAVSTDQLAIGGSYYVWVEVGNIGNAEAQGELSLRRTTPGGSTYWDADWNPVGLPVSVTVPAGATKDVWFKFDNVPAVGHFCLAALWDSDDDALKPYPADQDKVVTADNNIAQRNVNAVAFKPNEPAFRPFAIANNLSVPTRTSLTFTSIGAPFHQVGEIIVDLGPVMYQRWWQAGAFGSGIQQVSGSATQFRLISPQSKIEELPLQPFERITLWLRFTAGGGASSGVTYGLAVDQGKATPVTCNPGPAPCPPPPPRPPVGGVHYAIKVIR
ncbi:hypothetical protein [Allorhizocola rhizosphaerae]|uniref:hypothetical protein n=1 Tax=Allorhizocola rhizosphaerae TaxID=1872709 RepID=UPI0013C36634|nr:hypothetical protein [Allorhizocola rhizosphaerae]